MVSFILSVFSNHFYEMIYFDQDKALVHHHESWIEQILHLQGYDLELDKPTAAGTPLFVVQQADSYPTSAPIYEERSAPVGTSELDVPAAGTSPSEVQEDPRAELGPTEISDTAEQVAAAMVLGPPKRIIPAKPAFLIDDQTREVKVETYSERNK